MFNVVNLHLYHYAGNNPIKYVDPTGMYSIDDETGTIFCDLNNIDDLRIASTIFSQEDEWGINKCVATDSVSGNNITFNNSQAMINFVDNNLENINLDVQSLLDVIAVGGTLSKELLSSVSPQLSSALGNMGTFVSAVSTVASIEEMASNFNVDTVSDVVISGIALISGPVPAMASFGLSIGKKSIINVSSFLANLNQKLPAMYMEYYMTGKMPNPWN